MGSVIVITSGKGGVGKSTITAGLGVAFAKRGKKVLLIDMDQGLQSLDYILKIENASVYNVADLLNGQCSANQAIAKSNLFDNLYLIPAPPKADSIENVEKIKELCTYFAGWFDYVLVDSPAGVGKGFVAAASASHNALVVSTPDRLCARDANLVGEMLSQIGNVNARLVINMADATLMKQGVFLNIDEMIDQTALQLIGVVPRDSRVLKAYAKGEPLDTGAAAQAISNIADRLERKNTPLMDISKTNSTYSKNRRGF